MQTEGKESCCPLKSVAGISYKFVREDPDKAAEYDCKDACVYTREDDDSDEGREVCFKIGGNNDAQCIEEEVELGGCIGLYFNLNFYIITLG